MLLRDRMEPLARVIADMLFTCGIPSWTRAWEGYHMDQDLLVMGQRDDQTLDYVWHRNHEARIRLENIHFRDVDPKNLDMGDRIVLSNKPVSSDSIPWKNASRASQEFSLGKGRTLSENESNAILAGFEKTTTVTAEASGGIKGIGEAKASVEDQTTIKAEYQRQTGRSLETSTTAEFKLTMPPLTRGEARLTWNEQTSQIRMRGFRQIDCRIVIGRRQKHDGNWRWVKGSPKTWDSIEHLLAVMEKRGSVNHALFEEFANLSSINPVYVRRIRDRSRVDVDILTEPFKGAGEFRPEIMSSEPI